MLTSPSLENLFGRLDILKLVKSVSQKDDATALLELLCEVDGIQLPVLVGEDLVRRVFEPSKIEDAEELATLFFVETRRAQMCQKLVRVDGALGVPFLGYPLGKNLAGQLGRRR